MPTVVVLDTSLSMLLPAAVTTTTDRECETLLSSARSGIAMLCDLILESSKLEYISLVTFSEEAEVLVPFTRSSNDLFADLQTKIETKCRSRLAPALHLANSMCLSTWGRNTFCQIIVVTDGDCIELLDFELKDNLQTSEFGLPTAFPSAYHFMLLSPKSQTKLSFYSTLCQANIEHSKQFRNLTVSSNADDCLHWVYPMSCAALETTFKNITSKFHTPLMVRLRCGSLQATVQMHPPTLRTYSQLMDFDIQDRKLGSTIDVIGFMKLADLAHAAVVSRYLVLAVFDSENAEFNTARTKHGHTNPEKTPSFCALLHAALKSEDMAAICEVGNEWHGMLCVLTDGAKRSNLVLNCFDPGSCAIPWLGNLQDLRIKPFDGLADVKGAFPVEEAEKCSYFTSAQQPNLQHPCWVQTVGLQTDLQKLLRYARKLPEREFQYYQELNRLCSYATAIGFTDLLVNTLTNLLEKEKVNPQSNANAVSHITHTIKCIKALIDNPRYGEILPP